VILSWAKVRKRFSSYYLQSKEFIICNTMEVCITSQWNTVKKFAVDPNYRFSKNWNVSIHCETLKSIYFIMFWTFLCLTSIVFPVYRHFPFIIYSAFQCAAFSSRVAFLFRIAVMGQWNVVCWIVHSSSSSSLSSRGQAGCVWVINVTKECFVSQALAIVCGRLRYD
jgi:hypothetical protein